MTFELFEDEARQLLKFLSYQYISPEDYPLIHALIHRLRKGEDEKQEEKSVKK